MKTEKNTENKSFFANIFKVLAEFYLWCGPKKLAICILGTTIATIFTVVEPLFMAKTISFIEDSYKTNHFDTAGFLTFLGFWVLFIVANNILEYIRRYFLTDKPALEFHNIFAKKYVNNVYFMSMREYLGKKSGEIFKDFDRGTGAVFQTIFFLLGSAFKTLLGLFFALILLFWYNWKMAILALSMLPFMALVGYFISKKTHKPQSENEKKWTQAFGFVGDFLSNMQLGKNLRLESHFHAKFDSEIDEALRLQKFTSRWWSVSDMITSVFAMISRFLVIGGGIYFIWKWELTLAGLLLVFSFIEKIYYPVSYVFGSLPNLQKWDTQLEQFYKNFEKTETENMTEWKDFPLNFEKIIFKNVNFGYSDERKIFENLNFEIKKWQKIALVGNTGAGKSTIVSLLFRFYEPNSGNIFLDNTKISDLKKHFLRSHIGMVSQDNSLFNLTIRENLLFAKPDATDDEIKTALENASAQFVYNLEKGLDTKIGERGLKLSGGEKQRISIARLFLQNPEILVLDEATSALDNKTEKIIQKSLDRLMEGKTAIVIAHRLSTIQGVDKIFMLENGDIIEEWSYAELVAKWGKFAELADPSRLVIS